MAVCLDYQTVYMSRRLHFSHRVQVIAALVLLAAVGVRVWIKLACTDVGYDLAREKQKMIALDMERRELELERSIFLRADNLGGLAAKRLGLVSPKPVQLRRISGA